MNDTIRNGAVFFLFLFVGADLWQSYQSRQDSMQARQEAKASAERTSQQVDVLRKRVGHAQYVERTVTAYDKARAAGETAGAAAKKASEAKRQ